jgi:glycosyltransferase involved in cell wall biosynthesis
MEIILVATSLANRSEHSYRSIEEITATLRSYSLRYRVFAAKFVEPDILEDKHIIPHFTHNLYDAPYVYANSRPKTWLRWFERSRSAAFALEFVAAQLDRLGLGRGLGQQTKQLPFEQYLPLEHRDWKMLNNSHLADLAALPESVWSPDNLFVVMAISQNQLGGLVEFLRRRKPDQIPQVVCQLMFPPDWSPSGQPARLGGKFYSMAFKKAAPLIGKRLFFTTENEVMGDIYRRKFGIESKVLPVPLRVEKSVYVEKNKTVRLGFFGYSKSDKGFHLLPETAAICLEKGLDVEFHIQLQHSGWEQITIEAERLLRTMPNVYLIEGTLSSQEYVVQMKKADIMLLPYDPVRFGMRGSGVFTESITAGRPVIASEGTYAAECIKKGEAHGEIFSPYNSQACAAAIAKLLPRLSFYMERASEQAESFALAHGAEAYVDILLNFVK